MQINNLEEFVKYLTAEMHQRIPNSLVIWYDSVTYKGDLAWQDELNAKNRYILNQICQEFTCNVGCWQNVDPTGLDHS